MSLGPLFDQARDRRDEGIARAVANTDPESLDAWWRHYQEMLHEVEFLFCDDVVEAGIAKGLRMPKSGRSLGHIYKSGRQLGLAARTDQYRPSVRSNLSPKPVWRSLVVGKELLLLPLPEPEKPRGKR